MNQKLILGIATLIWGYQADLFGIAIPMAVILEAKYFVNRRWELNQKDFYLVANLTSAGFAGIIVFLLLNAKTYHFITSLFEWLPLVFFALVVVFGYSTTNRMTLDVLFHSLRRQKEPVTQSWDLDYFFLGICLLGAGINTGGATYYFPYLAIMICWALYPLRQLRYKTSLWILLVCSIFLTANITHGLLQIGHDDIRARTEKWIADWIRQRTDPLKTITAIGQIGRMKLSDSILFRIHPSEDRDFPRLLVEASYDLPTETEWSVMNTGFQTVPHRDDFNWRLADVSSDEKSAEIYLEFEEDRALIPLPGGIAELDNLPALEVKRNRYGTIQGNGLIPSPSFRIKYQPSQHNNSAVQESDLYIREEFEDLLSQVVPREKVTPEDAVAWLHSYFADFRYSLYQWDPDVAEAPLATFLFKTRAGHCEYFASSTALLLRQMGIPSRYVVGYSVQEYNDFLNMYVVRRRHAHAWAVAYIDGQWIPIDTTPGIWLESENRNAGFLQPYLDVIDNGVFLFQRWWNDQELEDYEVELYFVVGLLALVLIWRIYNSEQVILKRREPEDDTRITLPGMESPFFRVMAQLEQNGLLREKGELLTSFFERINSPELVPLLALHQRWRFDPRGLSERDKTKLNLFVNDWLNSAES